MADALGDSDPQIASALAKAGEFTAVDGVPIPHKSDLETPESASEWAEKEIIKAQPRAVQEVIHQLKRGGTAKERMAAAVKLLESAAELKEQKAKGTHQPPVIILTPQVVQNLPWAKQQAKLIEGELVNDKKNST